MAIIQCPTCHRPFDSETSAKSMPFCCERCQTIDLGRWLAEENGLPAEPEDLADAVPEARGQRGGGLRDR